MSKTPEASAPMDALTLNALKTSIAHWERHATGTAKPTEGIRGKDCALCQLFIYERSDESCEGCPVAEKTGLFQCVGTPWEYAALKWPGYDKSSPGFREAAQAMVKFLKDLLPKEAA